MKFNANKSILTENIFQTLKPYQEINVPVVAGKVITKDNTQSIEELSEIDVEWDIAVNPQNLTCVCKDISGNITIYWESPNTLMRQVITLQSYIKNIQAYAPCSSNNTLPKNVYRLYTSKKNREHKKK